MLTPERSGAHACLGIPTCPDTGLSPKEWCRLCLLSEIDALRAQVAALEEALLAAWPGLIEDEKYQRRAYEVPITEAWLLAKKALLGDVAGTREATSSGADKEADESKSRRAPAPGCRGEG